MSNRNDLGLTFSEWLDNAHLVRRELCGGALDEYEKAWKACEDPTEHRARLNTHQEQHEVSEQDSR